MDTGKKVRVKPSSVTDTSGMGIQKNPLLVDMPLQIIFEYLPFNILKSCRLVCRKWNSNASFALRHRAVISFRGGKSRHPKNYNKIIKSGQFATIPSSFKFECKTFIKCEMQTFFKKWGQDIEYLSFNKIRLTSKNNPLLESYDLTPWLVRSTKLKELSVHTLTFQLETPLELLRSITHLFLNRSTVSVKNEHYDKDNRLTPLKISLQHVRFKHQEKLLANVLLNSYFNFSTAKEIYITQEKTVFDLSVDVFKAKCVVLEDASDDHSSFVNWREWKGSVEFLYIDGINFIESNQLEIKQLLIRNATIRLCALPKSIEKIHIESGCKVMDHTGIIFPKLTYVKVDVDEYDIIACFKNCDTLTEIEFNTVRNPLFTLKLESLPKSVKKLKLAGEVNVVGDGHIYVGTLILKDTSVATAEKILCKIKPKILVLSCKSAGSFNFNTLISGQSRLKKLAVAIHSKKPVYYIYTPIKSVLTVNEFEKLECLNDLNERSKILLLKR